MILRAYILYHLFRDELKKKKNTVKRSMPFFSKPPRATYKPTYIHHIWFIKMRAHDIFIIAYTNYRRRFRIKLHVGAHGQERERAHPRNWPTFS